MAHRVALMYAGQIIEVATADAFFASPQHPYARALLQALPDADRPFKTATPPACLGDGRQGGPGFLAGLACLHLMNITKGARAD